MLSVIARGRPHARPRGYAGGVDVHLVDGTFELFRHFYAVPPARDADGQEVGAVRGVVQLGTEHARRRRHAPRRGHRPRDRVVQESPVAGLQDRRRHRPGALRRSSRARGVSRGVGASRSGRWSSSRPTTRSASAAVKAARDPRGRARASSARPTRTWRSACAARASCRSIGCAARPATKPASSRSSACRPRRFPTTWRWSATPPTAIRACRAGARSRPRPCWRTSGTSTRFPTTIAHWPVDVARAGALAATLKRDRRAGAAVPRAGDAAHRRAGVRHRRRAGMDRGPDAGVCGACATASTRPLIR